MSTKYVIDSSSLISLAKIERLEFLRELAPIFCPVEVYGETVTRGELKGIPNSIFIKEVFDQKIVVATQNTSTKKTTVDDLVLELARAEQATLITNDVNLGRRAELKNVTVMGSADVCLWKKEKNKITRQEYFRLINELVKKSRLSEKTAQKYLEE